MTNLRLYANKTYDEWFASGPMSKEAQRFADELAALNPDIAMWTLFDDEEILSLGERDAIEVAIQNLNTRG